MELPPEAIAEFKAIYERLEQRSIGKPEATAMAKNLMNLFLAVSKPPPTKWPIRTERENR